MVGEATQLKVEATPPPPSNSKPRRRASTGSSLRRYVLRRIGTSLIMLWGVITILFIITTAVPGDPVALLLGDEASADPVARAVVVERYGLDQPFFVRYVTYIGNLAQGDMGMSIRTRAPISEEVAKALPATLELGFIAAVVATFLGLSIGLISALYRGRFIDQFFRVVTLAGISMPLFWTAMISFYIFHFRLGWFPTIGRLSAGAVPPPTVTGAYTIDALLVGDSKTFWDAVDHILLPAIVLGAYQMTILARFSRSAVLEILTDDYVRTARAKGLSSSMVIGRHIFRAALVPIITVTGLVFTFIITGTVLIETIFAYPGLGNLMYQSAIFLDMPGIVGVGLLLGVMYVAMSFIVDILYGVIDPRIRIGD